MDKEAIRDAINKASSMYPYEVIGKPETYSLYNAGAGCCGLFVPTSRGGY